jgi:hypothetical protein
MAVAKRFSLKRCQRAEDMNESWYASVDMPSTAERAVLVPVSGALPERDASLASRRPGHHDRGRLGVLATTPGGWRTACLGLALIGCATGAGTSGPAVAPRAGASGKIGEIGLVAGPPPIVSSQTTVTLAGARCESSRCTCREPGRDDAETAPPSEGSKRFEIRMVANTGQASLEVSGIGTIAASGSEEKCVYVDLPAGGKHDVRLTARESIPGGGVAPVVRFVEYGPRGPYWYDVIAINCNGSEGRCDRHGADEWAAAASRRKRGRLDPCGSSVVTRLMWETSGGQIEREGGLFRDFTVSFDLDVKKFATQFPPGATECVPK